MNKEAYFKHKDMMEAYYKLDKESIWVKSDKWRLIHRPSFDCSTTIYALDDEYRDIRKALMDGKYVHNGVITFCDTVTAGYFTFTHRVDIYKIIEDFKPWTPTDGEEAWYIDPTDRHVLIDRSNSWAESSYVDSQLISLGLVLKTEEEADAKVAYMEAKYRVEQEIARLNEGWKPDFSMGNTINNYYIALDPDTVKLRIRSIYYAKVLEQSMYLKDEELAKQLIESHKEDLLTILEY